MARWSPGTSYRRKTPAAARCALIARHGDGFLGCISMLPPVEGQPAAYRTAHVGRHCAFHGDSAAGETLAAFARRAFPCGGVLREHSDSGWLGKTWAVMAAAGEAR